jgi:pimeloyl-ACP methyl ester carboxylesterase
MRTVLRLALLLALIGLGGLAAAPARARPARIPRAIPIPGQCKDDTLPNHKTAKTKICVPVLDWNNDLVVYAHGYVAFYQPVVFQNLSIGGFDLPTLVQLQGYAFATTSYRQNGLAVLEGAADIRELIGVFKAQYKAVNRIYLIGVSEGALVATLIAEQSPPLISGALALCGPIGDFKRQAEYFGDFRVLFDYFYPGILPSSPISVPTQLINNWESTYSPAAASAIRANPIVAKQLISTAQAAIDPADGTSLVSTTLNVLWYNVFATNDAVAKLGGNPYGNIGQVYAGSRDDKRLNQGVQRFAASPAALSNLAAYQTKGRPQVPLVTLHTLGDDVIPIWQADLYGDKVPPIWSFNLTQQTSPNYGHCNFTALEAQTALQTLVQQVATSQRARVYLPIVR